VKGIGPKKALQLVKEHRTLEDVLKQVTWEFKTRPEQILDFFKNPPVKNIEIEEQNLDIDGLRKQLIEEHNFSEERINFILDKLAKEKSFRGR